MLVIGPGPSCTIIPRLRFTLTGNTLKMNCFDARSPAELDRELRANDARVPGRTQGRTTTHTEPWVACRFLATIAGTDVLQFPVRGEPGDRPDLVLSGPAEKTGIELTEAISTDQAGAWH